MTQLVSPALVLVLLCGVAEAKNRPKALRSFTTYLKMHQGGKKKIQTIQARQSKYTNTALNKSKTNTHVDFHSAYEVGIKRFLDRNDGKRYVTYIETSKEKPMVNLRRKRNNTKSDLVIMTSSTSMGGWGKQGGWASTISYGLHIMAHEVGHNLNADHPEGICKRWYLRRKRATVMQSGFCSSKITQRFTNASLKHHGLKLGDKNHDNAKRMRDHSPTTASRK